MKYKHVDAFTDIAFAGNSCAVLFDCDALSDKTMFTIAREMNLSETAFIVSSKIADFGARYFTPSGEIPLAGHPTISVMHCLKEEGLITQDKVTLELPAGVVEITFEGDFIFMKQCPPLFMKRYDLKEIGSIFNLTSSDILGPVETVSTGTPMLMIHLSRIEVLRAIHFDLTIYKEFKERSDFFSPHFFVLNEYETFARNFDLPPAPLEDAFTGSATGSMASYLYRYGHLKEGLFVARQGDWIGRPGRGYVDVGEWGVRVGGQAITIVEGQLLGDFSR